MAALAGCAGTPPRPVAPDVVQVPVTRYVPIPETLTAPCPIAGPKDMTVGEAVRIARERRRALEACNAQLRQIRAVQGSPADGGLRP